MVWLAFIFIFHRQNFSLRATAGPHTFILNVLHVQDPESGYGGLSDSFSEKSVRLGFIRKVYSILSVQLVVTMAIIGIFRVEAVVDFSSERNQCGSLSLVEVQALMP